MTHNPIRPWRNIERRVSRQIRVGKVLVGGDAPISVQTMTNTLTHDVKATLEQAASLRSGNSGSVYFVVNGQTFGPAAPGANVVKNVSLGVEALMASYEPADPAKDTALAQFVADAGSAMATPVAE